LSHHQSVGLNEVVGPVAARERRVWVRCSCNLESSCQPVALPSASQPEMQWHAEVRDVSAGGLKLLLRRRFERGSALLIEIPTAEEGKIKTLAAVVIHVSHAPEGWVHGCRFEARPTQDELNELF